MQKLISLSLTQRLLVMLISLLLAAAGFQAFLQLPIDAFPDVSPTQVKVIIKVKCTPEMSQAP